MKFRYLCLLTCVLAVPLHAGDPIPPIPTLLAKRGELILHDDGSKDRGRKQSPTFENGAKIRAGAGKWQRSPEDEKVWRSTWPQKGHTPVMSYTGFKETDLVAEVTFRYGPMTKPWHDQCFRIAFDRRPDITGHIASAWANLNNDFIESGFLLQHIRKTKEKQIIQDLLLDHQSLSIKPEIWYTAVLEVVDNEALFRMGDHIAYSKANPIREPKNLVSLTLGKTWHEVRQVRIWKAEPNPEWEALKAKTVAPRRPFEPKPHQYKKP